MREIINETYTDMLMLWCYAEEDDSHEKIMTTKRNLMEDEEYDADEAIRFAVKKRIFLIQNFFLKLLKKSNACLSSTFYRFFNFRRRKLFLYFLIFVKDKFIKINSFE